MRRPLAQMSRREALALMAFLCSESTCGKRRTASPSNPSDLAIQMPDGSLLAATLFSAATPRPPALICLEERDRVAWASFARSAQREGFMSLTIDAQTAASAREPLSRNLDVDHALHSLAKTKSLALDRGADPDNLAMVGAGAGANLVLRYAVDDLDIQAVVLVSPALHGEGASAQDDIVAYGRRPSLLIVAEGDMASANACRDMRKVAGGLCELRAYAGTARGTDLLAANEQVCGQILFWLGAIVKGARRESAAGPGAAASNLVGP